MKQIANISSFESLCANARIFDPVATGTDGIEKGLLPYSDQHEDSPLTWIKDSQLDLVTSKLAYPAVNAFACERAIEHFFHVAKKFNQMFACCPNPPDFLREVKRMVENMEIISMDFCNKLTNNPEIMGVL